MISPLAAGLFHRAIFESSPTSTYPPLSVGLTRGKSFAGAAGCPGEDTETAACLRGLSAARILQLHTSGQNYGFVDGHVDFIKIYYDGINAAYTRDPIPGYNYKYGAD